MKTNVEIAASIHRNAAIWKAARRLAPIMQIRQIMHDKGLRNIDVAERLGVSEANISKFLKGDKNLQLDTLFLLGDAIGEALSISYGPESVRESADESGQCIENAIEADELFEVISEEVIEEPPATAGAVVHLHQYRTLRSALNRQVTSENKISGQEFFDESRAAYA